MQSNWKRQSGLWVTDFNDTDFPNVFNTTLKTGMNNSVLSVETDSTDLNGDGFPYTTNGGGQIVIDEGGGNEEYINYSSHDGDTFTVPAGGRGQNSTSAVAHSAGETIHLRNKVIVIDGIGEIERNNLDFIINGHIEIEVRNRKISSTTRDNVSIVFRKTDADNFYRAEFDFAENLNQLIAVQTRLVKVVSGSLTILDLLGTQANIAEVDTFFVSYKGSILDMGVLGVFGLNASDSAHSIGKVALSSMQMTGTMDVNRLTIGVPA